MAIPRQARDGVLILGGGFAGRYVARLVGTGSTIVSLENYMLPRDLAELGGLGRPRGLRDD